MTQPPLETVTTSTSRPAIELSPQPKARPRLALGLALLSIPGVTVAWDIGTAAGIIGVAAGIAAVGVGMQARAGLAGAKGTGIANAAVGIAALGLLSVVLFLLVGAPD